MIRQPRTELLITQYALDLKRELILTIKHVREQLKRFISSNEPEVLALKGKWGVGKTYTWNTILGESKKNDEIGMPKYVYLSLFGLSSLSDVRYSLFEQSISKDLIGEPPSLETFSKNTVSLGQSLGKKCAKYLKFLPQFQTSHGSFESLPFFAVKDTLICIDDLERRSNTLEIRDLLGLITTLKEQKNCKVIILLNDGEDRIEDYEKYREKVVDLELIFEPTPQECADIAFAHSGFIKANLSPLTHLLGIKNIRVLKKIERLYHLISELIQDYHPDIQKQVICSLVLFGWSHYRAGDKDIPTLEYIENLGYKLHGLDSNQDLSAEETLWNSILQKYGYMTTDELNKALIAFVKRGYLIHDEIEKPALILQSQIQAQEATGSFSNAWKVYHDSFNVEQDEVVRTLYDSFKTNVDHISPLNLNGTVILFRELGEHELADELIDLYIGHHGENPDYMNLKNYPFSGDITDETLRLKFEAKNSSLTRRQSPIEVLHRISRNNSWNPEDEDILAAVNAEEFYELFKSESGSDLSDIVNMCLKFGRFQNSNEKQQAISNNSTEALKRIARESKVNELRVRKFGVFLNEESHAENSGATD